MPSQSKSNSSEVAPVHTAVTSLRDPGLQCHSSSTKSPLKHSHCSRVIVSGKQCLNIKTNIHKHSCDNIGMFQIYILFTYSTSIISHSMSVGLLFNKVKHALAPACKTQVGVT